MIGRELHDGEWDFREGAKHPLIDKQKYTQVLTCI